MYIYIYRERDRERERYIYIYIYIYIGPRAQVYAGVGMFLVARKKLRK